MSVRRAGLLLGLGLAAFSVVEPAEAQRFRHESHAAVACNDCHANGLRTSPTNSGWCAACHHESASVATCGRCHDVDRLIPEPARRLVTFRLSVGEPRTRSLTFDHEPHRTLGCASCHTGGAALRVERECTSCHVEHHGAGARCVACHAEPPVTAHPAEVHLELAGCGAAGCHVSEGLDYAAMADERNLCLSCHVAQVEHEVPRPCAECHILSDPWPDGWGAGGGHDRPRRPER